jgi:flavin reductase ActVB
MSQESGHGPVPRARRPEADASARRDGLAAFRDALASFPSGVTVVTTRDADGAAKGFTATAFTSVSAVPPKVLVCLDCSAECFGSFIESERFAINVLATHQQDVALRFATKGGDKFAAASFLDGGHGVPVLDGAAAVLECEIDDRIVSGDHMILIGDVVDCRAHGHEPLVYFKRGFHRLSAMVHGRG